MQSAELLFCVSAFWKGCGGTSCKKVPPGSGFLNFSALLPDGQPPRCRRRWSPGHLSGGAGPHPGSQAGLPAG